VSEKENCLISAFLTYSTPVWSDKQHKSQQGLFFITAVYLIVICDTLWESGMSKPKWHAYSDLAWTESIVTSPDESAEETELFVKVIKENSNIEVRTLLHLGCGAGANDYTFKMHFSVTGVDISDGMLEIAEKRNPEVTYVYGDMREIDLNECFDAVAIPDSIGYMTTIEDLRAAINTACKHLRPGGVLLIVAHTSEGFRENNFAYTGSKEDIDVTIFENNYVSKSDRTIYEATFVYLIRQKGKLVIYTDCHTLGVFTRATWIALLTDAGLEIKQIKMDHSFDRFILGEGQYPLLVFICIKPL